MLHPSHHAVHVEVFLVLLFASLDLHLAVLLSVLKENICEGIVCLEECVVP